MLKKGFTLAETIITLGIIGVVVAITTPIVIHSTAKAQVGPKLAKTVAIFEQANAAILQTNNSNSMLAKYYKNNAFDYEKYSAELNNYLKSNITANSVRFVPAAYAVKVRGNTESGTLKYDWTDPASYTYEPEIVKQGNRFGVRLKASAPSYHIIKADIQTEVSPIVGSEKQSGELVRFLLTGFEEDPKKIWESNIFGKSLHDLVNEGLNAKLNKMPQDARGNVQGTLQKIINEGSGGLICILI